MQILTSPSCSFVFFMEERCDEIAYALGTFDAVDISLAIANRGTRREIRPGKKAMLDRLKNPEIFSQKSLGGFASSAHFIVERER